MSLKPAGFFSLGFELGSDGILGTNSELWVIPEFDEVTLRRPKSSQPPHLMYVVHICERDIRILANGTATF